MSVLSFGLELVDIVNHCWMKKNLRSLLLLILYVEEFIVTEMMLWSQKKKTALFWLSKVNNGLAWKNIRHFATPPTATSRNDVRPERRNSILIARHYQDLGTDSDWSCCVWNLLQPIRSTTQIWVVRRHQYGISALVSQMSFRGETVGGVAKCRLFLFRRMMDLL